MTMKVTDGAGDDHGMRVDPNHRAHVNAQNTTEEQAAAIRGDGYNINTGKISLSGTSASAIIYLKNTGTVDYVIDSIAMGVSDGTVADIGELLFIVQPTAGDITTDKTAVDMNENRRSGSTRTLDATVYKGKDGGTLTGGRDAGLFFQGDNGRLFATFAWVVPPGTTVGMTYNPQLSSGTVNVYVAFIGHVADPKDN